jgi:hypothetical protein
VKTVFREIALAFLTQRDAETPRPSSCKLSAIEKRSKEDLMKQFLLVFVTAARRPYELGRSPIRNYFLGFFEQLQFEALE